MYKTIKGNGYTYDSEGNIFPQRSFKDWLLRRPSTNKIYFSTNDRGYLMVQFGEQDIPVEAHLVLYIKFHDNLEIPEGYVIDHVDLTRTFDNSLNNLTLITLEEFVQKRVDLIGKHYSLEQVFTKPDNFPDKHVNMFNTEGNFNLKALREEVEQVISLVKQKEVKGYIEKR